MREQQFEKSVTRWRSRNSWSTNCNGSIWVKRNRVRLTGMPSDESSTHRILLLIRIARNEKVAWDPISYKCTSIRAPNNVAVRQHVFTSLLVSLAIHYTRARAPHSNHTTRCEWIIHILTVKIWNEMKLDYLYCSYSCSCIQARTSPQPHWEVRGR